MDDARCWMRAKQRGAPGLTMSESGHNLNTYAQPTQHHSYDSSWEEKAFAEDAAGPLGGCIWPPRSYSCNFCGRVFRSAQALGGHMNVHRRDRARLNQSIIPQDSFDHHQPSHQLQHSKKPFVALHVPSHLAYNPNPNPISFEIPAPSSLALKFSSSSATQYISIDQEPTFVQLGLREYRSSNIPKRPGSKNMVVADQNIQTSDLARKGGSQILKDLGEKALMHCVKPDISVNLNLFLFQTRANNNESGEDDYEDDEVGDNMSGSKRRKLTADESSTMSSSYIKSSIVDRLDVQQKLFPARRSPSSSIQELDLELRLGERPKVK